MKKYFSILLGVVLFVIIVAPFTVSAWAPGQPFIPCGRTGPDCDFNGFIQLLRNAIDAMFIFSIPIVALVFAYAGYLYLTAMGNSSQASKARGIFTSVLMGFVIMLSAWLIVKVITDGLLSDSFKKDLPIQLGS